MENIQAIREKLGVSRAEFARLLEIPYRTVQDWELGNRVPPEYIVKLIEFYMDNKK